MSTSALRSHRWHKIRRFGKTLLCLAAVAVGSRAVPASAQLHNFPNIGESARIEAEDFSARSEGWPYAEDCADCSGGRRLIFFQEKRWFELDVSVPRLMTYSISMRVASQFGASVEVEMVNDVGTSYLTTIYVPATGAWDAYQETTPQMIAVPAGVRTLRFTNPSSGANIDYITVDASTFCDAVSNKPTCKKLGPYSNPMKGFGSSWDRKNEPWATVGFQYIEWGKFEPVDEGFDWAYVDAILDRPGTKGRHIIIQFVVDWDNHDDQVPAADAYRGPAWLPQKITDNGGIPEFTGPSVVDPNRPDRIGRATNYNDATFIAEATHAIGVLFNGDGTHPGLRTDPRTFVIQIGVLGYFGEWHNYPNTAEWGPTAETKRAIFNAYMSNLGEDDLTQIRYPEEPEAPAQKRLGYTNGSATPTPHGFELGTVTGALELWRNGPIGGEWPPAIAKTYWQRFFASRQGEFFLRQGGYSTMTPPTAEEIASNVPRFSTAPNSFFMHLHRTMGYNFRVDSVTHLVAADESGMVHIDVELSNVGIAPFYKEWDVELGILNTNTGELVAGLTTNVDITTLMPKEKLKISGSVFAPLLDSAEQYQIALRIVQPGAKETKPNGWKLEARNTYIELHNDINKQLGYWDEFNALQGGWNIVAEVKFE